MSTQPVELTGATTTAQESSPSAPAKMAGSPPAQDVEPARKRRKLSSDSSDGICKDGQLLFKSNDNSTIDSNTTNMDRDITFEEQHRREREVGIREFVHPDNPGFSAIFKQRYTDFLVNEIDPDGTVLHLTSTTLPPELVSAALKPKDLNQKISSETPEASKSELHSETHVADDNASVGTVEKAPKWNLDTEDLLLLDEYLSQPVTVQLVNMYRSYQQKPNAKSSSFGSVTTKAIEDKEIRTKIHMVEVRRAFNSTFESESGPWGVIKFTIAPRKNNLSRNNSTPRGEQRGKLGWQELGGEYLHFTLYKENKDTMEVITYLSNKLKMRPKMFSFAGTKDRRGVTVQRVSVYRVRAERLAALNRELRGAKLGHFKYEKHALELGDLSGNQFVITLRDCHFYGLEKKIIKQKVDMGSRIVEDALYNLQRRGFINYFGLQRFGSFNRRTDEVGKFILQGNAKAAVEAILDYDDIALSAYDATDAVFTADGRLVGRDDKYRAYALYLFKSTGKAHEALEILPKKFTGETAILRHLGRRDASNDYMGALLQINRNLRLMYVHAYQSLVWNHVVTARWLEYGDQVMRGDLVLVTNDTNDKKVNSDNTKPEVDQNGEIVIGPASDDIAAPQEERFQRARPLTASEALSDQWTIFDVVLPTPGFDVVYPENDIKRVYEEFMASDQGGNLNPHDMRRKQKDFSLSGSYRKIMSRVNDVSFQVKPYTDRNAQLVETDLDRILNSEQHVAADKLRQAKNQRDTDSSTQSGTSDIDKGSKTSQTAAGHDIPSIRSQLDRTPPIRDDLFISPQNIKGWKSPPPLPDPAEERNAIFKALDPAYLPEPVGTPPNREETSATPHPNAEVIGVKRSADERLDDSRMERWASITGFAVVVKFRLSGSQYATMALRELMKQGGLREFKPEFAGGR